VRSAFSRFAFLRLAPDRSAAINLVFERSVRCKTVPKSFLSDKSSPDKSSPDKSSPDKSTSSLFFNFSITHLFSIATYVSKLPN